MRIPNIVRCPYCKSIFKKGYGVRKFRYKCPLCHDYILIWDIKEFYRCKDYKFMKIKYSEVKPLIDIKKRKCIT